AGLWGAVGQRVLVVGEFPLAAPPPEPVAFAVDRHARDVLVLTAPVGDDAACTLAFALRPGLVRQWSTDIAASGGVAVVLRDREDRPLFGPPELAALVPGYAAVPPAAPAARTSPL